MVLKIQIEKYFYYLLFLFELIPILRYKTCILVLGTLFKKRIFLNASAFFKGLKYKRRCLLARVLNYHNFNFFALIWVSRIDVNLVLSHFCDLK